MIHPAGAGEIWPLFLAGFAVAYLLGSIPFGVILTRLGGAGDIRRIGSGNIGATNVLRTGRKGLAALTLLLDAGKGWLAVFLAGRFYGPDMAIAACYGVLIGHIFPLWLRFHGGKGVSTALGVLLALSWPVGLVAFAIWIAVIAASRLSSLAALVASVTAPVIAYLLVTPRMAEICIVIAVLIWLRHIGNIRRLLRGEESRIGSRS